jgi:hypothetical protein
MSNKPATFFQEFFYEYLPPPKQEILQEINARGNDPMRLPYRVGLSMGRSMIWGVVILALLPALLSFWLWVLSLIFLVIAVGLGAVVAKYIAIRFPSFWYLHPSFLIGSHEDVIRLYSWSSLQHAEGNRRFLTLVFPGESFTIICPKRNAKEYAEMAIQFSKRARAIQGDWLALL